MVASSKIPSRRHYTQLKTAHAIPPSRKRHFSPKRIKGKRVGHFISRKHFLKGIKRLFSYTKLLKNIRNRRISHLQKAIVLQSTTGSNNVDRRIGKMVLASACGNFKEVVKQKNLLRQQINQDMIDQRKGSSAGGDDTRALFMKWAESIKNTPQSEQICQLLKTPKSQLHRNAVAFMSIYGGVHDYTPYQADIVSSYNLLMRCLVQVLMPSLEETQYINDAIQKEDSNPSEHTMALLKKILIGLSH
ncbi:hypothetical protein [Endozoicomonas sp.]|uniref:hypothetical protein n=1 Tax=Endozoicomonas sp. TaxID=1892382 RepID=UPI003AF88873